MTVWLKNGKVLFLNGSVVDCPDCPCDPPSDSLSESQSQSSNSGSSSHGTNPPCCEYPTEALNAHVSVPGLGISEDVTLSPGDGIWSGSKMVCGYALVIQMWRNATLDLVVAELRWDPECLQFGQASEICDFIQCEPFLWTFTFIVDFVNCCGSDEGEGEMKVTVTE